MIVDIHIYSPSSYSECIIYNFPLFVYGYHYLIDDDFVGIEMLKLGEIYLNVLASCSSFYTIVDAIHDSMSHTADVEFVNFLRLCEIYISTSLLECVCHRFDCFCCSCARWTLIRLSMCLHKRETEDECESEIFSCSQYFLCWSFHCI